MVRFLLNHWLLIGCPIVQAVHAVFMRGDNPYRKPNIFCLRVNVTRRVGLLGRILMINHLVSFVRGQEDSKGVDVLWNY
jgi:hypothetical protein